MLFAGYREILEATAGQVSLSRWALLMVSRHTLISDCSLCLFISLSFFQSYLSFSTFLAVFVAVSIFFSSRVLTI